MNNLRILKAEILKILGDAKAYWFNLIFGNLNIFFLFLGVFYGFSKTNYTSDNIFQLLIGLMIWYYGVHAIDLIAIIIEEEAEEGTLEQVFMTRTSFVKVLFYRIIAQIIFDTIKGIFVFALCIVAFEIPIDFIVSVNWFLTIIVFIITLSGLYGIGYLVAGFSIVYKKVSSIAGAFSYLLLFFTGLIVELDKLPKLFSLVAKILPLHWGMVTLNDLISNDYDLFAILKTNNLFILILVSGVWIIGGILLFKLFKRKAINNGTLNQY